MSQLADYIRLKQEKDRAVEEELCQKAAIAALVPALWTESVEGLREAIKAANSDFEAANEPNRFQCQVEEGLPAGHRYAQGELHHFGAPEKPLSATRIVVEKSGEMIFHNTVGGRILKPGSARLEPDFDWDVLLAWLYKRDERLDER